VLTITMLVKDLCAMIDSDFVYTITKNGYGEVKSTNADETYLLFGGLINAYAEMMQKIHKVDEQEIYYELSALLYSRERVVRINNGVGRTILKYAMEKEELDALKAIRYRKYWDAHKEEYDSLLNEKEQLMAEVKTVTAEIYELSGDQNFPEKIELDKKRAELNSLGIFAGKRKKELEEELVALRKALKVREDEVMMRKTPLIAKKQQLETRLREIDFEISKER